PVVWRCVVHFDYSRRWNFELTGQDMNRRTFLKTVVLSTVCAADAELLGRESTAAVSKSTSVRLDPDGMLVINQRREFVLGLYMLPNAPEPWREAQEAGFNLIHVRPEAAEFAEAHAHNLYGWTSLGSISPRNRAEAQDRIRK